MKTRRKNITIRKNSWFTEYAHRWPDAALPMAYAMACVEVVSKNSEKASSIYKNILKAWVKPETNDLYIEVTSRMSNSEVEEWKELIRHPESLIKSDINEPWNKFPLALQDEGYMKKFLEENFGINAELVEDNYPEVVNLIKLVCKFISIGFNREIEIRQGKYRVVPTFSPPWLLLSVMCRTSLESKNITSDVMRKIYKVRKIKGKIYDFEDIMRKQPMSRKHRWAVAAAKETGAFLHHDKKFINAAWLWYQCRVMHSGIKEFLDSEAEKGNLLDLKNIQKEVKLCDHAIGYQRRGSTLD